MKKYKVKTTYIDHYVGLEDIEEIYGESVENLDDNDIEKLRNEIKSRLPQVLELEIECEPEDLSDMVCDAVSNETFWLNNEVRYDIISEKNI